MPTEKSKVALYGIYIGDVLLTYIISSSYGIFDIFTCRTVYAMAVYMYFYKGFLSLCASVHHVLMTH